MTTEKQMEEDLAYLRMKLWLAKRRTPLSPTCQALETQVKMLEQSVETTKPPKS